MEAMMVKLKREQNGTVMSADVELRHVFFTAAILDFSMPTEPGKTVLIEPGNF